MFHTNPAEKVAHVMPRLTCYMHACVHVVLIILIIHRNIPGPVAQSVKVSGYRCVSDCISRGREFDPGPVPYFRGD